MSDVSRMLQRFQKFPVEFEASATVEVFASRLPHPGDGAVIAHYAARPGSWTHQLFRTAKAHGLEKCPHRYLSMPEAKTVADLIEDVRMFPMLTGGRTADELRRHVGGRVYLSGRRDEIPSGHFGGRYEWSADWLKRGDLVRAHMGAVQYWSSYGRPVPALLAAYGEDGRTDYEWRMGCLEFIRWDDGRTLVTARANNGFASQWVAVLDVGAADVESMIPQEQRDFLATERKKMRQAWEVPQTFAVSWYDRANNQGGVFLETDIKQVKAVADEKRAAGFEVDSIKPHKPEV